MGGKSFDVLLRDLLSTKSRQLEWDTAQILENVAWLKRMNASGHNIFVRPSGEHGLALLGGLVGADLAKMGRDGLVPAATIEIANEAFEAWVTLSRSGLPPRLRQMAESGLMTFIDHAGREATSDGFGLLAGFVNQRQGADGTWNGNQVLILSDSPAVSPIATQYLERARTTLLAGSRHFREDAPTLRLPVRTKQRGRGR